MAGFYKASNRTRQLKYTVAERNARLVLEAMESLEKYQNSNNNDMRGTVVTTIREIADIIEDREAKKVKVSPMTISRCISKLEKDNDIEVVNKGTLNTTPSTYKLLSFSKNVTDEIADTNDLDSLDVTVSKNGTVSGTVSVTDKMTDTNGLDNLDGTVSGTIGVTPIIRTNNKNIYTSNFDKIWKLYPRKNQKRSAYEKYKKLSKKYSDDEIERAVKRYAKEIADNGTEMKYIKMGEGFFNPAKGKILNYLDSEYEDVTDSDTDYMSDGNKQMNEEDVIWR